MAKIFELKGIHYSYPSKVKALSGIDFDIDKGCMATVIGANGTGKSTLLTMLDGLIFPQEGTIMFSGQELNKEHFADTAFVRSFRQKVGFVFQNADIQLFCPTVREDIMFGPMHLGLDRTEAEKRFDELVCILELQNFVDRTPSQLSVGEKRKAALATVLIMKPEVLIMDEPTAGLDPLTTRHIIDIVLELNSHGCTVITATHDLHIVNEISNEIFIMGRDKTIVRRGKPEDILMDTELLRNNNLLHIHKHKHGSKLHVHPHMHFIHHE